MVLQSENNNFFRNELKEQKSCMSYMNKELDNPQGQGIIVEIPKGGSSKYGVSNQQGAKGKINILSNPICH